MTEGVSLDSLLTSLSGFGSASSNLADLSISGAQTQVIPLIDYGQFSKHIFFGDAVRRYRAAIERIENYYPIGSAATPDVASLCAENIYAVDMYLKESDGFDLWVLDELSKDQPINGVKGSITAGAVNDHGQIVPLIHVIRNSNNVITGSQVEIYDSLSARSENFEKENREQIDQQSGTSINIITTPQEVTREINVYGVTAENIISRSNKLSNMLPEILFQGDNDGILEKTLAAIADQIDELKLYIETIPDVKRLDYGDINRTPNKFLPVMAREFGVELFDGVIDIDIAKGLVVSTSGAMSNKEITYEVWNRILNNVMYLLKTKGTRETIEAIGRLYGVDHNFIKVNEYSLFNGPTIVRETEEIDVAVLESMGDVYVQTTSHPITGSANAFDFASGKDFTLEMRVSATAGKPVGSTGHVLFRHPLYEVMINASGQAAFLSTITASLSSITPFNSTSSYVQSVDNFVNVAVSRSGNGWNVFLMALTASPTGGNDVIMLTSGSTTHTDISLANLNSTGGTDGLFAAYFPGSGSFTGYIHEVRSWDVALNIEDMFEHTRNFESTSIQNSTASPYNALPSSLSAHYKLKENMILSDPYNFIVDSSTAGNTASPNYFTTPSPAPGAGNNITEKRYRVFSNQKKVTNYYPTGFASDNDRIRQSDIGDNQQDIGYVSFSLNPIDMINRQIKNQYQDINIYDLMGNAGDHRMGNYTGALPARWHEITSQWGLAKEIKLSTDDVTNKRIKSGGSYPIVDSNMPPIRIGEGPSGASGNTIGMIDINNFTKAMDNFNDTFGGMFPFVKQFLPAKTNIISEGIFIEPHMLERSKMKRRFGHRETGMPTGPQPEGLNTMTADGNVISSDEGRTEYNSAPSIVEHTLTSFIISTHHVISDVEVTGANSANSTALIASAATTATFQGYHYKDNNVQQTIDNSITSTIQTQRLSKTSTVNFPTFSSTRFGRFLPIKVTPANPAISEVEITLDQLLIAPTASVDATNGFINGRVRLLTGGIAFKTSTPALRFEFPTSSDGTNFFIGEVGDIDRGQGREVKDKDISITTPLESEDIQFKLTLNEVITSLSAVNADRYVDQKILTDTISGSIGIVPIKITNLFNNTTYTFRVGINSDVNRETNLITQITQQGIEKIKS
tara:strand:+ start:4103 stop:7519 length:3417 start_codon:yes stop_codon:yes gene_type:complete